MTQDQPGAVDYALMLTLALMWGGAFMAIKVAVETIPPIAIVMGRVVLAGMIFFAIVWATRRALPRGRKTWIVIFGAAMTGTVIPFFLIAWGQEIVDAGPAAILMGAVPLFTIVLAHMFVPGDRLSTGKMVGVVFGLAGIVVLVGPAALAQLGTDVIRQVAIALAALCYAITSILMKALAHEDAYAVSAAMMLLGSLVVVPVNFAVVPPWTYEPSLVAIVAVIAIAVFPTALANILILTLLRRQGPSFFAQINYLVPLAGVGWGMVVLSERPGANAWIALALILVGIAIARIGTTRQRKPNPEVIR